MENTTPRCEDCRAGWVPVEDPDLGDYVDVRCPDCKR